jgi:hypothetical protein
VIALEGTWLELVGGKRLRWEIFFTERNGLKDLDAPRDLDEDPQAS